MFKVGDRVKCIEDTSPGVSLKKVSLKKDSEYIVHRVLNPLIHLAGVAGGWYHHCFELVDDGRTSRTTDPITSKGKRKVNKYEQAVLDTLRIAADSGVPEGFTGKDIANFTDHPLNCITPRFAPLRRKGLIKDSNAKRDKQIVWVLA